MVGCDTVTSALIYDTDFTKSIYLRQGFANKCRTLEWHEARCGKVKVKYLYRTYVSSSLYDLDILS